MSAVVPWYHTCCAIYVTNSKISAKLTLTFRHASLPTPTFTNNSSKSCKRINASRNRYKKSTVKSRSCLAKLTIFWRTSSNSSLNPQRTPEPLNAPVNKPRKTP